MAFLVPGDGFHEPPGVSWGPQQVDGFLPGVVVLGGHQHHIAAPGADAHRGVVVIDLLDEREEARAGLTSTDGHELLLHLVRDYGTRHVPICAMTWCSAQRDRNPR